MLIRKIVRERALFLLATKFIIHKKMYGGLSINARSLTTQYEYIKPYISYIWHHIVTYMHYFAQIMLNAIADTHPSYFILGAVFALFAATIFIAVRYPFWNTHPVYHTYDFWRGIGTTTPYIIQKIPTKTRYYLKETHDMKTKTMLWSRLSRPDIQKLLKLINMHYISSDRILLDIQENEWTANFCDNSFVTLSYSGENMNAFISSRPILSRINNTDVQLFYIDYMTCSNSTANKTPLNNHSLFSTHEYNVRLQTSLMSANPVASLIKQESGECFGVVPFCKYELVQYYLNPLNAWTLPNFQPEIQLVSCISIHGVGKKRKYENTHILTDFAKSFMNLDMFDVKIWSGLPAMLRHFEAGDVRMYALTNKGNLLGIYFMRNTRTYYEELEGANMIECVASINFIFTDSGWELFYGGFLLAIRESMLAFTNDVPCRVLSMPSIGHNVYLNSKLPTKDVIMRTPCQYILHNMVAPKSPYSPEKCLIIL